jgi:glycosyltransferase involved in cell wall biosynthesis
MEIESYEGSDERPFVTVVMPVRNESSFIRQSLGAVLAQDYPADRTEILIADGMSDDGTREAIRHMCPNGRVRIIDNPERIAPTGLNRAYKQAQGSILVRIDGHCVVSPAHISRCVALLEEHACEGVGGPIKTIGASWMSKAIAACMSSSFGVGGSAFRVLKDRELWADTIPFPAYTRAAVEKIGLYDEELVRNQDDEYNARLRKAGGRLLLSPQLVSRYYSRSSLGRLARQYFQYGFWKVRVLQKHPAQMKSRHFVPVLLVLAMLVSILASMTGWIPVAVPLAIIASYLVPLLIATLMTCWRLGYSYAGILPLIFATLHLSYGAGFLLGLIRFWNRWTDHVGRVPQL